MYELRAQVAEIQASCDGLEKERDFYFDSACHLALMGSEADESLSELRNIELIVQQRTAIEGIEVGERDTLARLQEILYSTVEGFEVKHLGKLLGAQADLPPGSRQRTSCGGREW